MLMKVAAQLFVGFLVLIVDWYTVHSDERKYVEIRWIDLGLPFIEFVQGNMPRVSLPVVLKKAIEHEFPNYRVPESQDYEGDWAERYDYPEQRESKVLINREQLIRQKVPFLTLGDFNHDEMQDIAVLMVGKKQKNVWKLVVFHGGKTGYQPIVLVASSEQIKDNAHKNSDYGPVSRYEIRTETKCRDGRECLELGASEAAGFQYVWKNGRYIEVNTHD